MVGPEDSKYEGTRDIKAEHVREPEEMKIRYVL